MDIQQLDVPETAKSYQGMTEHSINYIEVLSWMPLVLQVCSRSSKVINDFRF